MIKIIKFITDEYGRIDYDDMGKVKRIIEVYEVENGDIKKISSVDNIETYNYYIVTPFHLVISGGDEDKLAHKEVYVKYETLDRQLSIDKKETAAVDHDKNKKKIRELVLEKKNIDYLLKLKGVENKLELKQRKFEIKIQLDELRSENVRLTHYLRNRVYSKYKGLKHKQGLCYKIFKKTARELTSEQRKEYDQIRYKLKKGELTYEKLNLCN